METYKKVGNLQIAEALYDFINLEALPGTETDQGQFWHDLEQLITDLTPENEAVLKRREVLQRKINDFHQQNKDATFETYKEFLEEINYFTPVAEDFTIGTEHVDQELKQAGDRKSTRLNSSHGS